MLKYLITIVCAMLLAGCGEKVVSYRSLPTADSEFAAIWHYASALEVEKYAAGKFGSFPEGLRKAVTEHRIGFFSSEKVEGSKQDLQCYLFFEYRRQKALSGTAAPGKPDDDTARYVRALLTKLNAFRR